MTGDARSVGQFLVSCTREHDWFTPSAEAIRLATRLEPERVVDAARYHRISGCVLASLGDAPDAPQPLVHQLGPTVRRARGYAVLVAAALRTTRAALDDAVPWVVLKGPVLDGVLYARPGLRSYRDLDILVPPRDLERAVGLLEAAGYRLVDRNWRLILQTMAGELHLEREGSAPIDLHWSLLFDDELRSAFRFDVPAMMARARTVTVAGGAARAFDEADTLIYLAVHGAIEGGDRLVWLKDVDVAARAHPRWDDVVDRASAYGVQLPVATMLHRAARTLGAPVPDEVVARLAPAPWRAILGTADALFPPASSRGFGSPSTLLTRAARDDGQATAREAFRGAWRRLRAVSKGRFERVDVRFDAADRGSLLYPAGGDRDREEYFSRVVTR